MEKYIKKIQEYIKDLINNLSIDILKMVLNDRVINSEIILLK